jgi:hypothetical protein
VHRQDGQEFQSVPGANVGDILYGYSHDMALYWWTRVAHMWYGHKTYRDANQPRSKMEAQPAWSYTRRRPAKAQPVWSYTRWRGYCMFKIGVCVCMCVRACVYACVRVYVCVCGCVGVGVRVHARARACGHVCVRGCVRACVCVKCFRRVSGGLELA